MEKNMVGKEDSPKGGPAMFLCGDWLSAKFVDTSHQ
jgi:hypothetical protein